MSGWIIDYTGKRYNGSNEPCDMWVGPCSCGAWHTQDEYDDLIEFLIEPNSNRTHKKQEKSTWPDDPDTLCDY